MKPDKAYEAIDTLVQGMDTHEQSQLFEHLRNTYPEQLGPVAVNGAGTETPAEQAETVTLTPEQQEKAAKLTTAMAEKFGVKESDFSVLAIETEAGQTNHAVIYTALNGIDPGNARKTYDPKRSWNGIFDKKAQKNFTVKVDGQEVDTRTGMTREVYRAFIADAKAKGIDPLPDSPQLDGKRGTMWTDTWLTGEEADGFNAPVAYVRKVGVVYVGRNHRDYDFRVVRFRPAVVIE